MKILKLKVLNFIVLYSLLIQLSAQDYPYEIAQYPFIRYDINYLNFSDDSSSFEQLFEKFDTLIIRGKGKINAVHIGDSHVQGGVFSGRMAQRLQTFYPGLNGGKGMIFPYRMARTNSQRGTYVKYSSKWKACNCVKKKNNCLLGLTGMSVETDDSTAEFTIFLRDGEFPLYEFNKIKILYPPNDSALFNISLKNENQIVSIKNNFEKGITEINLSQHLDSVVFVLKQTNSNQNFFKLLGLIFENNDPGIVYQGLGVSGSKLDSYLRCELFGEHLSLLKPDWVICSLGTNDAYCKRFDSLAYQSNYEHLISKIKHVSPTAAIILTVPNDSYLFRRFPNKNTATARAIIYQVAQKYKCAVWDFYSVMGGYNSILLWQNYGLCARDKIHLTSTGYALQADLFFNAFLRAYDNHIEHSFKLNQSQK